MYRREKNIKDDMKHVLEQKHRESASEDWDSRDKNDTSNDEKLRYSFTIFDNSASSKLEKKGWYFSLLP